jgi:RHS repeat-associated protein
MEVVEENTGVLLVEDRINEIQTLATDNLIMQEAGFLEVYINNEAQTPVYYDNFTVATTTSNVVEINAYYPHGMLMPGLSLIAPPGKWNGYKFSAKELQKELGLNWGDHGARMADYTVGRWWIPDPLAEKRPWESTYSFCGNNPVNRIDPDGRKWKTTLDEEIAKRIRSSLSTEVKSLDKRAASLQKDMDKINNNTKLSDEKRTDQLAKKESRLSEVNVTRNYIADMNSKIGMLSESSTIYSFNNLGENASSGFLSSPKEGEIVINHVGGINPFGNQVHETVHATQYERGLFQRSTNDPSIFVFKDMNNYHNLEISAYLFQYVVAPRSMPYSTYGTVRSVRDINVRWLRGIRGTNGIPMYR